MNSISLRAMRGLLLREVITLLLFSSLMLQSMQAAAPGWWTTQNALKPQAQADDFAALNQGQLKNLVRAAIYELHAKLPGGAGGLLNNLLSTWRTQKLNSDDYAAVTVGQLKAVAKPIYTSMQAAGLQLPMPWSELTTDDDDYAAANIGQAKTVFAFVVPNLTLMGQTDSDGDGFSDALELALGTNPYSAASHPVGMSGDMAGGSGGNNGGNGGNGGAGSGGLPPYVDPYADQAWPDFDSTEDEDKDTDNDGTPDAEDMVPYDPKFKGPKSGMPHYNIVDMGPGSLVDMADNGAMHWTGNYASGQSNTHYVWTPANPQTRSFQWSTAKALDAGLEYYQDGQLRGAITEDGYILGDGNYFDGEGIQQGRRRFLYRVGEERDDAKWLPFSFPRSGDRYYLWGHFDSPIVGPGGKVYGTQSYYRQGGGDAGVYTTYYDLIADQAHFDDDRNAINDDFGGVMQSLVAASGTGLLRMTEEDAFEYNDDDELEYTSYTQTYELVTGSGAAKQIKVLNMDDPEDMIVDPDYGPLSRWWLGAVSPAEVPWFVGAQTYWTDLMDSETYTDKAWIYRPNDAGTYEGSFIYASAKDKTAGKPISQINLITAQGQAFVVGDFDEDTEGDETGLWADGQVQVIDKVISGYERYSSWYLQDVSRDGMIGATAAKMLENGQTEYHVLLLIPFYMKQVTPDGDLAQNGSGVSVSMPSPVIDMQCSVTAVRVQTGGGVVGDLEVSGTITSAFCDTVKGEKGKITSAKLWVNGDDEPFTTIEVTADKQDSGPLNKPYPYSGTFNTTINDVPLTDGNNFFQFTAADQIYQISGYSKWVASIDVTSPENGTPLTNPNGTFALNATLPAATLSSSTVDTLILAANLDGTSYTGQPLTETAAASGVFFGSLPGDIPVRLTLYGIVGLTTAAKENMRAILLVGAPGSAVAYNIIIHEGASASGVFSGGYISSSSETGGAGRAAPPLPDADPPPDGPAADTPPALVATVVDYADLVAASNGGELNVYAMVAGMPEEMAEKFRLKVGPNQFKFIKNPESGQISATEDNGTDGNPALIALMSFRQQDATPPELTEKDEDYYQASKDLSFIEGVSKGLNAGGMDMVDSFGDVVIGWSKYVGRGMVVYGFEARLIARHIGGSETEEITDLLTEWNAPNKDINNQAFKVAKFLTSLIVNTAEQAANVHLAMITGNVNLLMTALHGSEEHKTIFMVIATALKSAMEDYKDATPGQQGYICGRIWFEAFATALPFTRLGKLPQLAKVAALERLEASGLLKTGSRAAVAAEKASLLISKMCFVAGTLVLTKTGPMRIEDVKEGMLVWSRDEYGVAVGWKNVVQTFTTHPTTIHQVTYDLGDLQGDGPSGAGLAAGLSSKTETLGVTGPHPFWVCNREHPGFVAAADLKIGDALFTADGRSATITANVTRHAGEGTSFHTYNFEVEDFHTYFVGGSGVWVHNFSNLFCDELQSLLDKIRKEVFGIADGAPLDGKKFAILDAGFDYERSKAKAVMSKQGNFALHVTGVDEIASYAQRFPNGSINNPVDDIFSYEKQKAMQRKFVNNADVDKPSYHYEVHHLSEKRVSRALDVPESQWDSCPGINLPERPPPTNGGFDTKDVTHYHEKFGRDPVYHQGENGIAKAIDQIFTDMRIPDTGKIPLNLDQKKELVIRLCHLYQHDVRYRHLQLWPATRDWLSQHVNGVPIPDNVPSVLDF